MTLPESMTPRHYHSITATSLGPGLTEVLVFGGRREMLGKEISETTILRFGEQLRVLVHAAIETYYLIDKYRRCSIRGRSYIKAALK